MESYLPYLLELESVLIDAKTSSSHSTCITNSIKGHRAKSELRRLISIDDLRETGAFFTGSNLASEALKYLVKTINKSSVVLDPTCGAGDLLIHCLANGPKFKTLHDLLNYLSNNFIGRDLHENFVEVTKLRLFLSATSDHGFSSIKKSIETKKQLPNIVAKSIFEDLGVVQNATHIVLNPPYTMIKAPAEYQWSSGKVNSAAVFFDAIIRSAKPGTRIAAILPDVLRSGTRYRRWRGFVSNSCEVKRVRQWDRFDDQTDVHVFILDCIVKKNNYNKKEISPVDWISSPVVSEAVGDYFNVSVGPVVHYRDPNKGHWHPYLVSKELPVWKTVSEVSKRRRYIGRTYHPPFVVIRRVSRPEDSFRARATLIRGDRPVAVDNHLIVLTPNNGTIKKCQELLKVLKDERTNNWINQRNRCRHLTVSSIKELPWWKQ